MFRFIWNKKLQCYCAEHNPTIRADKEGNVFGGGSTKVETPSAPAAPSVTSSMEDYVKNYPALFQLMQEYMPKEAAMQVGIAEQYAGNLGKAYKTAQEQMYPEETKINQALNQQIQEGMSREAPQWYKDKWLDYYRSNLGTNTGSGLGADYVSRGMLEQEKAWGDYYKNLALAVTGRQPIATAQTPQTTNQLATYTPQSVLNYNASNYGSYTNLYGQMYQSNTQRAMQNQMMPYYYMSAAGNMMRGAGSMMSPGGQG